MTMAAFASGFFSGMLFIMAAALVVAKVEGL